MPFPGEVEAKRLYPENVANLKVESSSGLVWSFYTLLCGFSQKFAPVDKYYTFNVG